MDRPDDELKSLALAAYLKQGHVNAVRYFAGKETIEVDTVETWSATDRYTAQALRNQPLHTMPQTINIQMTPRGWYIDKIAFGPTRN